MTKDTQPESADIRARRKMAEWSGVKFDGKLSSNSFQKNEGILKYINNMDPIEIVRNVRGR